MFQEQSLIRKSLMDAVIVLLKMMENALLYVSMALNTDIKKNGLMSLILMSLIVHIYAALKWKKKLAML